MYGCVSACHARSFLSAYERNSTIAAAYHREEVPAEEPATEDPAAPAPTVEALPSDVTGQTAAETRCSAGRTLDDQ